jgi:hypothetical protein
MQIDQLKGQVLHVFDRNGADVGIYAGGQHGFAGAVQPPFEFEVYLPGHGVTFAVNPENGTNVVGVTTYLFTEPDCTGQTYAKVAGRLLQPPFGTEELFFATSTAPVLISPVAGSNQPSESLDPSRSCDPTDSTPVYVVPVTQVDPATDLGLSFPLPAPLYVAPLSSAP